MYTLRGSNNATELKRAGIIADSRYRQFFYSVICGIGTKNGPVTIFHNIIVTITPRNVYNLYLLPICSKHT